MKPTEDSPMIRRLFNLMSLLSALMFVASAILMMVPFHVSVTGWEAYNGFGYLNLWKYGRHPWRIEWNLGATLLVSAVLPICWIGFRAVERAVREARRRAAVSKGLCVHCGYDLRSTPERCPECGKVPEPAGRVAKDGSSAERTS